MKVTSVNVIMAPGFDQSTKDYSDFEVEDLDSDEEQPDTNNQQEEPVQEVETLIDGLNWFTKL